MLLKITGKDKQSLEANLNKILNVSSFICLKGKIPSQDDLQNPEETGKWWLRQKELNLVDLLPAQNSSWLKCREEGENYLIVEFSFRYDDGSHKKNSISNLMLAFFDFVEDISLPPVIRDKKPYPTFL